MKDITFNISKSIDNAHIVKEIVIHDNEINCKFTEKVKLINLDTFKMYFEQSGFSIEHAYGNYQLEKFDVESSPRMIMIARKIKQHESK